MPEAQHSLVQTAEDEDLLRRPVDYSIRLSELFAHMHTGPFISQLRMVDVVNDENIYIGSVCLTSGPMAADLMNQAVMNMVGDAPATSH